MPGTFFIAHRGPGNRTRGVQSGCRVMLRDAGSSVLEQFSKCRGGLWLAGAMEYGLWNLHRGHKSA
jgi:hypothetical protein